MNIVTKEGFDFGFNPSGCDTCAGNCCIGESGYIWITKAEISKLAILLNLSIEEVGLKYLIKVGYRYTIKEKQLSPDNFACEFFDLNKKQCTIYDARPVQCRTFPFWDYFKENKEEVFKECPAITNI